jgi:hypothetical protein
MISITVKQRNTIFYSGLLLFILSIASYLLLFREIAELPDYLFIACIIPLTASLAMLFIDKYRAWDTLTSRERYYASYMLLATPIFILGSAIYYIKSLYVGS